MGTTSEAARNLAFAVAVIVLAIGAVGMFVPPSLVWIAERSTTTLAFSVIAAVRIALGLVLFSAASATRMPQTVRFVGSLTLIAGILTAVVGLVDMERGRALVEWYLQQGSFLVRLTGLLVLAVGGFLAWACAPRRRAA